MFRKLLYVFLAFVAVNFLARALATDPGIAIAGVLAWLLVGYLVVRAWPGVRHDLAVLVSRGRTLDGVRLPGRRSTHIDGGF